MDHVQQLANCNHIETLPQNHKETSLTITLKDHNACIIDIEKTLSKC